MSPALVLGTELEMVSDKNSQLFSAKLLVMKAGIRKIQPLSEDGQQR